MGSRPLRIAGRVIVSMADGSCLNCNQLDEFMLNGGQGACDVIPDQRRKARGGWS